MRRYGWLLLALVVFVAGAGALSGESPPGALAALEEDGEHSVFLPLVIKPLPLVDLSVEIRSAPQPYVAGAPLTYTVTVANAGPATLHALQLDAWLPDAVEAPVWTPSAGSYDTLSGTWEGFTLTVGQALTLRIAGTVTETFTGTLWNSVVVTPALAQELRPEDNGLIDVNPLPLQNPGFEGGHWHETFEGQNPNMPVPEAWVAWWVVGQEGVSDLGVPEILSVIDSSNPHYLEPVPRIRSGEQALKLARWGAYRAGVYQRLTDLPPGATVVFSAYAHAWACQDDPPPPLSCADPFAFRSRVGIDPAGGTASDLDGVMWSDDAWLYDVFGEVGPVTATVGPEGTITVYLESFGKWPLKHNDAYWDDASLILRP